LKRTILAIIGLSILLIILLPLIAIANEKITRSNQTVVQTTTNNGQRILRPQQNLFKIDYQLHEVFKPIKQPTQPEAGKQNAPQQKKENPAYNGRHYSAEEVIELIKQYAQLFGIRSDAPLCIAKLESGYNQFSKNKKSSASGVFQYLSGTWKATDEGRAGLSVLDADANVRAAIKYMASRLNAKPWTVAPKCPPIKKLTP
jgi:hypothetical protein